MTTSTIPGSRSTTAYAILGLLAVRSWTTYELAKQMQRSLHWMWPRAERKLYDEPKRLVADGLATAAVEATGKRPRTVYTITTAGRVELRRWLDDPPAPRTEEFEAMLKVFFADAGSAEQLTTTLDRIEAQAMETISQMRDYAAGVAAAPLFPRRLHITAITLRLRFEQELGLATWAHWARAQVRTWQTGEDPGSWDATTALIELVADADVVLADFNGRAEQTPSGS